MVYPSTLLLTSMHKSLPVPLFRLSTLCFEAGSALSGFLLIFGFKHHSLLRKYFALVPIFDT
jgi:hypothetical protein